MRSFFAMRSCFLLFFFLILAIAQSTPLPPKVLGSSIMVVDANTGRVLFSRNPNEQRGVGSTQKLLTALIVIEHGDLQHPVTIKRVDEATVSCMLNMRPGDHYTREELLHALLIDSANDAARALARDQAGSVEEFSVMMNKKAAELGMSSSHFITPNGLSVEGQYSTAADMAKLAMAAYRDPLIRSIIATKYYPFRYTSGKVRKLRNSNRTMRRNDFCNGMKTGYTDKSKHCLITSGTYGDNDVISVILGTNDRFQLFTDSANMLRWALGIPPKTKPTSSTTRNSSRRRKPRVRKATLHRHTPRKS